MSLKIPLVNLIVNADDFGLTPGVNRAICKLFEAGIVTSTSALACGHFIEDGLADLPEEYHGTVGLHICLDEEIPVCDPVTISSLVNQQTGKFKNRLKLIQDLFLKKISQEDLFKEIRAQFNRLIDLGIKPDHLDCHGHLHVFPQVANVVAEVLKKSKVFKIKIRRPIESCRSALITVRNLKRLPISWMISFAASQAFARQYRGYITSTRFMGLLDSGHINRCVVEHWVKNIENSAGHTVEIMCHPGFENDTGSNGYKHWGYEWRSEYEALLYLRNLFLSRRNIRLINYKELSG